VKLDLGRSKIPEFRVPEGMTSEQYLRKLATEGLLRRFQEMRKRSGKFRGEEEEHYRRRLEYELAVIENTGFAGYFLIVWDFIRFAKEQGIPVGPGRGSAAGSLVAYCLRITEVDPLSYGLLFERFLNPERISLPDIDCDFCKDRRDEVIRYVEDNYGKENVAQIITFGTMKARAAVRDVGRVLEMPYADVDKIAKLIPPDLGMTIEKARDCPATPLPTPPGWSSRTGRSPSTSLCTETRTATSRRSTRCSTSRRSGWSSSISWACGRSRQSTTPGN
jgi:DNA polymerase-3 subunit alpha